MSKPGPRYKRFIELAKYHPEGKRGTAIYLGANTAYEDVDTQTAMQHANANTLLGVIIETREAVENMDEILIPGIDLTLVGYQDLAQSLGAPGQFNNPELLEATARVNALCHERGIATAAAVTQLDNVQAIIDSGAQYLLYGTGPDPAAPGGATRRRGTCALSERLSALDTFPSYLNPASTIHPSQRLKAFRRLSSSKGGQHEVRYFL